jgi:2-polyprenyl-6-methoxyphenol hydroxylase-like FAD-dependent oxidoreductase
MRNQPLSLEREDTLEIPDTMPEVLVVGAGPVGLFAALSLAELGIRVQIVDQERRPAARSYALALHPQSLRLLDEAGLADELLPMAHRVSSMAFYEGPERQAAVDFSVLPWALPCVAVLPQQILEGALESRLLRRGIPVLWNHRVSEITLTQGAVVAEVERLERGAVDQATVKERFDVRADFVLDADGHCSQIRKSIAEPFEEMGPAELFAIFEVTASGPAEHEAKVVFQDGKASVLWPLGGRRFRWSLEIEDWEGFEEPRFKSRHFPRVDDDPFPYLVREKLHELLAERAPWFVNDIGEIVWSMAVRFERRLAGRFSRGRVWLAGDAAHLASPIGAQSMNGGLSEARDLASRLASILREDYPLSVLDRFEDSRRTEWRRLLGSDAQAGAAAGPWVREHAQRLLPCLPASGGDLAVLMNQLGLELA